MRNFCLFSPLPLLHFLFSYFKSPPTADIEELFKIQDKQLRKLEQLAKKTNELCEELHFDNLVVKVETRAEQQKSSSAVNVSEKKKEHEKKLILNL